MVTTVNIDSASNLKEWIGMKFEKDGFDVEFTTKNEMGYDFSAKKGKSLIAVQVKNYKKRVPVNVVLKFMDFIESSNFDYGSIISSKGFSEAAISVMAAQGLKNIQMGHFCDDTKTLKWDYIGKPTTSPTSTKPHYISVFTATGGVGKTIVSAHLAGAFALSGYKANIVDGDPEANLHRLTGDIAIVPNSLTGKNNAVKVSKMKNWKNSNHDQESITVFDCSPVLKENNIKLLKKTDSFIIPTWLKSPLQIGNKAEVLLRTITQIRKYNKSAYVFILFNNYSQLTKTTDARLIKTKNIIARKTDSRCIIIDPEKDVSIRYSKILENWGSEPDLAFKSIGGRCHPRDDFLRLSEYLLEKLTINQQ